MSIGNVIRNLIFVRKADPKFEPVKEWVSANTRTGFDPKVLDYPSTEVLAAYNGKTTAYGVIKTVAVFDSVGFAPALDQVSKTAAMVEIVKATVTLAYHGGIRELLFLTTSDSVAGGAELMGFKELESLRVFRMELPNEDNH